MRVFLPACYALSAALFLTGFMKINAATEEEELIFIPTQKEVNMGRKFHKQVKKHFDLPVDPLMQKRIENIGRKLALNSDRKDLVYHFNVLAYEEEGMYNAFAAPGGYIYIFEDLVEELGSDDSVAAVLAHEMAHVEAKHSVKRMQGSLGLTALMLAGSQVRNKKRGTASSMYEALGQLMSAYSRSDERQADRLSIKYMERAGYDKQGVIDSLRTLRELRKQGPEMVYSEQKSHPYISERMAYLEKGVEGEMDFDAYINMVSEDDTF
jgi:predicted Zn-dependent protease